MRFTSFPPSPSRRQRQFRDFAVAVKTWVFIPWFLSCTLHSLVFFSLFINTNHVGMCQATPTAFCALFTDKNQKNGRKRSFNDHEDKIISVRQILWVYLDVKTCEVFLCFIAIIFLGSTVLTSQLLCVLCFSSLVNLTGVYTEEEPILYCKTI